MSRSRPTTEIENPIEIHLSFNGKTGQFGFKYEGEEEWENLPSGTTFGVLCSKRYQLKGRDDDGISTRSNIVHMDQRFKWNTEIFSVARDGEEIAKGTYSKVKNIAGEHKAKLHRLIHIAMPTDENGSVTWKVARISFKGLAAIAFDNFLREKAKEGIDFENDNWLMVYQGSKTIKGTSAATRNNDYEVPVFGHEVLEEKYADKLIDLDKTLQEYFDQVNAAYNESKENQPPAEPTEDEKELQETMDAAGVAKDDETNALEVTYLAKYVNIHEKFNEMDIKEDWETCCMKMERNNFPDEAKLRLADALKKRLIAFGQEMMSPKIDGTIDDMPF